MAQLSHRNFSPKFTLPTLGTLLSAAVLALLWACGPTSTKPEEGAPHSQLPNPTLSTRVISPEKDRSITATEFVTHPPQPSPADFTASPRFFSSAQSPSHPSSYDKLRDDEAHLSALATAKEAESRHAGGGIRISLILEAAKRALISPTPWSDLSLVALSFKKAGDEESARYWFQRASRLALDPDDPASASRALREVVKQIVAAGCYDLATELIPQIPEIKVQSQARTDLVKAHAGQKNFAAAHQLALTLSEVTARGSALRSIAESEARTGDLDAALRTAQSIPEPVERDRTFGTVAGLRATLGDFQGALTWLKKISDSQSRDASIARVANIDEQGGALPVDSLLGLIKDPTFRDETLLNLISNQAARKGIDSASSSVPRLATPGARARANESLVMLQIRQGDFDGALNRAQAIPSEGIRHRAIQAIAVAEVKGHGAGPARHVANLINDESLRESTLSQIAQRAATFGQNEGAVDTISHIADPSARAMAFANVGLTQARKGQDRSAHLMLQDATRELRNVPNTGDRARTQGLVAQIFAETGDANSALTTAAGIGNHRLRDSTYQRVALSFAKISQPAIAEQSAQLIERPATRERALDSVATTLASQVALTDAVGYAARLEGHRQQVRFLLGVAARKS